MRSRLPIYSLVLVLTLAMTPAVFVYGQQTGTSPQPGTSSQQSPSQPTPALQNSSPDNENTAPNVGETQSAAPATGVGNTQTVASRNVGWGWLILGFFIGL
ncbi:MAG TPA: hypothetical protein VKY31_06535, partial [Terriglobia bacterium]|nr:hypothetical protein [Terriglobia bacterium]